MPVVKTTRRPKILPPKLPVYVSPSDESSEDELDAFGFPIEPKKGDGKVKVYSASEIARSVKNWEKWANQQACERATMGDIPDSLRDDIKKVFDFGAFIPIQWVDEESEIKLFLGDLTPKFVAFLKRAHDSSPSLFYDMSKGSKSRRTLSDRERHRLFSDLHAVYLAWRRLRTMVSRGEKWSEGEYAAHVYDVIRTPAFNSSTARIKCSISLPRPHRRSDVYLPPKFTPKTIIPDGLVFVNPEHLVHLSEKTQSPFKVLARYKETFDRATSATAALREEATPCSALSARPRFDFASCVWEDKKPTDAEMLDLAYRQNRMSCASVARQLHAFHINAPTFGILWAQGKVRCHIDWAEDMEPRSFPRIFSAPYTGLDDHPAMALSFTSETSIGTQVRSPSEFSEWDLTQPHEMLQVYKLLRNIDIWTSTDFKDRIASSLEVVVRDVKSREIQLDAWKRETEPPYLLPPIKAKTRARGPGKENKRVPR